MNTTEPPYPDEPRRPDDYNLKDEWWLSIIVINLFGVPILSIINLSIMSGVMWSLVLSFIISAAVYAHHKTKENAILNDYNARRAVYEKQMAAWEKWAAESRACREAYNRAEEAKMQSEKERQQREYQARRQREEALAAYDKAVADRRQKMEWYYDNFNAAYNHVKYEVSLHGVTNPDDVLKVFVEKFKHLPQFREYEAGLLRHHESDPRVAAVRHMLPPLPPSPKRLQ